MEHTHPFEVALEKGDQGYRERGDTVLGALAGTHRQLLHRVVEVLDSQPDRLHDSQPTAVEDLGHELGRALQEGENTGDLFAGHDDGDLTLLAGAYGVDFAGKRLFQNVFIQIHQGVHGLILGRRGDVAVHGQMGEECLDLGLS
jgi:hypothetical protein